MTPRDRKPALLPAYERYLADQQADVRNVAEKAKVVMEKRGYVSEDLAKAIDRMKALEEKLRQRRPSNYVSDVQAVSEKLSGVKKSLRDQIEVNRDLSRPGLKQKRDDIQNAMDEEIPGEFKDWVKAYYKSLSE